MEQPTTPLINSFKSAISEFLNQRRGDKLDKLKPDETEKRAAVLQQHRPGTWIADAARRAGQIRIATHTLKATHPDARGTSLFCPPDTLKQHKLVGTHSLNKASRDVVGNAAALDVFSFLKTEVDGRSLLDYMLEGNESLAKALSGEPEQAREWIAAFTAITQTGNDLASHAYAKQIYWLVGDEPSDNSHYHLLAPLYSSALAHEVFNRINNNRYGEAAKLARQARRNEENHDSGFATYPGLATQKMGGTKPQNISQLNSERRGTNYLLSCAPPNWRKQGKRPLWRINSAVEYFCKNQAMRSSVERLKHFLKTEPAKTQRTRRRVTRDINFLVGELIMQAAQYQEALTAGWSADPACRLPREEQLWLDPYRASVDEVFRADWLELDWPLEIARRFANWVNTSLESDQLFGDEEHRLWAKALMRHERWREQLETLRPGDYTQEKEASEATP